MVSREGCWLRLKARVKLGGFGTADKVCMMVVVRWRVVCRGVYRASTEGDRAVGCSKCGGSGRAGAYVTLMDVEQGGGVRRGRGSRGGGGDMSRRESEGGGEAEDKGGKGEGGGGR